MVKYSAITIIGAGPAGQVASLFLAKKGIKALLVDKGEHPRVKACADIVGGQAVRILHEIDPELVLQTDFANKYQAIKGTLIHTPNGKSLNIPFVKLKNIEHLPTCIAMPRIEFDNVLHEKIMATGMIDYLPNTAISNWQKDENAKEWLLLDAKKEPIIRTKLLIIATGSSASLPFTVGNLARDDKHNALGIRGYFTNVTNSTMPDYGEMFFMEKLMPGGLYIGPFNNGLANVNIVMRSDMVKKSGHNLNALFWDAVNTHPILKERFKHAEQIGKLEGCALHLGTKKRPISGEGYMLAGDAGGLIDLISGNGIPQAMISGKIAAEQAAIAFAQNDFSAAMLKAYDLKVYKKIDDSLKLSRLMAPAMGSRFFPKLILKWLNFITTRKNAEAQLGLLLNTKTITAHLLNPMFYWKFMR
jgi:flavin-dependent dehydrogenase